MMEATDRSSAPEAAGVDLLLNLPTLAQAAFWVIVVTFVGVLLASVVGGAPIRMEPIVLSLLLLPARAVLAYPDKQRAAREDGGAMRQLTESGVVDRLTAEINRIADEDYGLKRPIGLVIAESGGIQAVCSWRRDYLFMSQVTARNMARSLDTNPDVARAILYHELAHIAHRDHQRVGFAGELLRGSFTILPWWMLFLALWLGAARQGIAAALAIDFTQLPGLDAAAGEMLNEALLPDAAARAEILARAAATDLASILIFVFISLLPIAMTSGILYLFFWRWMVRLQEQYADVAAKARGVSLFHLQFGMGFAAPLRNKGTGDKRWSISSLRSRKPEIRLTPKPARLSWFRMHPSQRERMAVFEQPALLYTDWKRVAWSTAILSVGLDAILASPLFAYHGVLLHLYTATALLLLSTWMLPRLVTGERIRGDLTRALAVIIGVRAIWLAFNIGILFVQLLFFPDNARALLNAIVVAGSRYTGPVGDVSLGASFSGVSVAFAAILLEALQFGGLLLGLALYIWWLRRTPNDTPTTKIRRRHWGAVVALTLAIYILMWPLASFISRL